MTKNQKKVLRKINIFFEQVLKTKFIKVPLIILEDEQAINKILQSQIINLHKYKAKKIKIHVACEGEDFVNQTTTILFKFNHAKLDKRL